MRRRIPQIYLFNVPPSSVFFAEDPRPRQDSLNVEDVLGRKGKGKDEGEFTYRHAARHVSRTPPTTTAVDVGSGWG